MGKISDKSSYKNMKSAVKSTQFFITKQAVKKAKAKIVESGENKQ